MAARGNRAKLIVTQVFFLTLLFVFALSFYVDPLVPAMSGAENQRPRTLTPSIFDVLWRAPDLPKKILKMGMPYLGYMEKVRDDKEVPGIGVQVLSWFLGFLPESPGDILVSQFPRVPPAKSGMAFPGDDLEKDWGLTSVLFSLPEGQVVQPVTYVPGAPPVVAVYHTHATESYLPELGKGKPSEAFTDDMSKSVVRVGELLVNMLQANYGIPCLHSETVHDVDGRLGAYYRSEATVKAIVKKYPDCKVLIDVHRDSQPSSITSATIRGKKYAKLMFVLGTDNPNWVSNYRYVKELTSKLEEAYPGITRGIFYESAIYNQKYSPKAILVEVGGVENTLVECKNSMEALAWALATTLLPLPPKRP